MLLLAGGHWRQVLNLAIHAISIIIRLYIVNIQIQISIPNTAVCCVNEMRLFGHGTLIAFGACDRACLLCAEDSVKAIDPGDIFIQIYP